MAPLKRDLIDHLDLFQVIFMRLPILNTLDFVCVMRKQEHVMPFDVSVQEQETLGKV